FFITVNRLEAPKQRLEDYTSTHPQYGLELFYYVALVLFHQGDYTNAVRFIGQIPEDQAFSPKVFYLRGQIAEKLDRSKEAGREYLKAVKMPKIGETHSKSRLRLARLFQKVDRFKQSEEQLDYIIDKKQYVSRNELAEAYYLRSFVFERKKNYDAALAD